MIIFLNSINHLALLVGTDCVLSQEEYEIFFKINECHTNLAF